MGWCLRDRQCKTAPPGSALQQTRQGIRARGWMLFTLKVGKGTESGTAGGSKRELERWGVPVPLRGDPTELLPACALFPVPPPLTSPALLCVTTTRGINLRFSKGIYKLGPGKAGKWLCPTRGAHPAVRQ